MPKPTILPLDPKALAGALKRGKKDRFYLRRADGYTYATDGIMMVRVPAELETALLAETMKLYPETFRADGSYRDGQYSTNVPDLESLWPHHVPDNAAELPQLIDTRLTLRIAVDTPPYAVYACAAGGYTYLPGPYVQTLTNNITLRAEHRPDPDTGASSAPVHVEFGGTIVAVIMPYLVEHPKYLAATTPAPANQAQDPAQDPAA